MRIEERSLGVMLLAAWLCAGCQGYPRNGQPLPNASDNVQFSGFTNVPGDVLTFQIQSQSSQSWVSLSYGDVSATTPFVDNSGVSWYEYGLDSVRLPFGSASAPYWRKASAVSGQRRVRADVRTWSKANGALHTFDYGQAADICIQVYGQTGGTAIMNNCLSRKSPEAELYLNCGKSSQECCMAYDVPIAQRCDSGRLCDSASKCTIASGGKDQPCNGDGSCGSGLGCIKNVCRDIAIEKMPLYTLEVQVKNCASTSFSSNATDDAVFLYLNGDQVVLDTPADDFKAGQTNTFGVRPAGIAKLGDITKFELRIGSTKMCIDEFKLIANGQTVFTKTYGSSLLMNGMYPFQGDYETIPRDDMRDAWRKLSTATYCQAPASIAGAALDRMFEGVLIDTIASNGDLDGSWGGGGLTLTRASSSRAVADVTFHANPYIEDIGRIGVTVKADFDVTISCADRKLAVNVGAIDVNDIQGGAVYDFFNTWSQGLIGFLTESYAQSIVDEQAGSLQDALKSLATKVAVCPVTAFNTSAPPSVTFQYPNPVVAGSFIPPSAIDLCRLPVIP